METVTLAIEDVLDLHAFLPEEVNDLLNEYFTQCIKAKIFSVRIIHGKGRGVLRKRVHGILEKNDRVKSFKSAPGDAGGWGATLVELA
jgi:dsDNA-specific endonuclease/ATPase MutS2